MMNLRRKVALYCNIFTSCSKSSEECELSKENWIPSVKFALRIMTSSFKSIK